MLVSVYMTVKNGEDFISDAIRSVISQTYDEWELVIVDDGSTDSTINLINNFLKRYSRIKLIATNGIGRGRALNLAVESCRGEYVCNLDSDDLFHPQKLEIQTCFLLSNRLDFCCGKTTLFDSGVNFNEISPKQIEKVEAKSISQDIYKKNQVSHITAMFRKSVITSMSGYNESRKSQFDYELWLRLTQHKIPLYKLNLILAAKRIHPGQSFEANKRLHYVTNSMKLQFSYILKQPVLYRFFPYVIAKWVYGLLPRGFRVQVNKDRSGN